MRTVVSVVTALLCLAASFEPARGAGPSPPAEATPNSARRSRRRCGGSSRPSAREGPPLQEVVALAKGREDVLADVIRTKSFVAPHRGRVAARRHRRSRPFSGSRGWRDGVEAPSPAGRHDASNAALFFGPGDSGQARAARGLRPRHDHDRGLGVVARTRGEGREVRLPRARREAGQPLEPDAGGAAPARRPPARLPAHLRDRSRSRVPGRDRPRRTCDLGRGADLRGPVGRHRPRATADSSTRAATRRAAECSSRTRRASSFARSTTLRSTTASRAAATRPRSSRSGDTGSRRSKSPSSATWTSPRRWRDSAPPRETRTRAEIVKRFNHLDAGEHFWLRALDRVPHEWNPSARIVDPRQAARRSDETPRGDLGAGQEGVRLHQGDEPGQRDRRDRARRRENCGSGSIPSSSISARP